MMNSSQNNDRRGNRWPVSIAPMMERTDRHFRYFMRQITRHTLLYTEMATAQAILHGDREKLLSHEEIERPLALQLGGNDPRQLSDCARIAQDWGYTEVNFNVGCPSGRVQNASFGACLMADPHQVARCVEAMRNATTLPVTVKHRIGIDHRDDYWHLSQFVRIVAQAGCDRFIVHARTARLKGLNPRENRIIPPLRYEEVYRLKSEYPDLRIEINGGIKTIADIQTHLKHLDGVMIGRAVYENPFLFASVDALFYGGQAPAPTRREVLEAMIPYIGEWSLRRISPHHIIRHLLGLFAFQPGSRAWKRYLSENIHKPGTTGDVLIEAMRCIPARVLDERPQRLTPVRPLFTASNQ